ncbi:hypothetical protein INT45_005028 [Circinella minor]|uniref:Uncharacterized protein n=1 Tax=Circinella minor TaxID=1195481 RepID=A0A8H7VFP5_9FUNG|nr:hypothetical protein INT45_005028 [Circinella minor]
MNLLGYRLEIPNGLGRAPGGSAYISCPMNARKRLRLYVIDSLSLSRSTQPQQYCSSNPPDTLDNLDVKVEESHGNVILFLGYRLEIPNGLGRAPGGSAYISCPMNARKRLRLYVIDSLSLSRSTQPQQYCSSNPPDTLDNLDVEESHGNVILFLGYRLEIPNGLGRAPGGSAYISCPMNARKRLRLYVIDSLSLSRSTQPQQYCSSNPPDTLDNLDVKVEESHGNVILFLGYRLEIPNGLGRAPGGSAYISCPMNARKRLRLYVIDSLSLSRSTQPQQYCSSNPPDTLDNLDVKVEESHGNVILFLGYRLEIPNGLGRAPGGSAYISCPMNARKRLRLYVIDSLSLSRSTQPQQYCSSNPPDTLDNLDVKVEESHGNVILFLGYRLEIPNGLGRAPGGSAYISCPMNARKRLRLYVIDSLSLSRSTQPQQYCSSNPPDTLDNLDVEESHELGYRLEIPNGLGRAPGGSAYISCPMNARKRLRLYVIDSLSLSRSTQPQQYCSSNPPDTLDNLDVKVEESHGNVILFVPS